MPTPKTPADQIKQTRESLGLSQSGFAETFRLSLRTLQQWERGGAEPTGPAAVYLWLIGQMPKAIMKALKNYRPGGSRN
jgi:DNA-binding transcriptional regulator YiaG